MDNAFIKDNGGMENFMDGVNLYYLHLERTNKGE
jgi:hypothetical protein